jgi:hypothetical protein
MCMQARRLQSKTPNPRRKAQILNQPPTKPNRNMRIHSSEKAQSLRVASQRPCAPPPYAQGLSLSL